MKFQNRIRQRFRREVCRRVARRLHYFALSRPIISFTFDDFPRNAATVGGRILKQFGVSATYYVSLGLAGTEEPTGRMFERDDLAGLLAGGHELGCHTFDHRHAWETDAATFATSLDRNLAELKKQFADLSFETMSYPISCPNPGVKRAAARHFAVCRGGGQTYNLGVMDRNYLKAFFLEKSRDSVATVTALIDQACKINAWLIFATHDISDHPTPYGCTPKFFEEVVRYASKSGALALPVGRAWKNISSIAR